MEAWWVLRSCRAPPVLTCCGSPRQTPPARRLPALGFCLAPSPLCPLLFGIRIHHSQELRGLQGRDRLRYLGTVVAGASFTPTHRQAVPSPRADSHQKGPKASIPRAQRLTAAWIFPTSSSRKALAALRGCPQAGMEDPSHQLPAQEPEPAAKGGSAFLQPPGAREQGSSWQRGAGLAQNLPRSHPESGRGHRGCPLLSLPPAFDIQPAAPRLNTQSPSSDTLHQGSWG